MQKMQEESNQSNEGNFVLEGKRNLKRGGEIPQIKFFNPNLIKTSHTTYKKTSHTLYLLYK